MLPDVAQYVRSLKLAGAAFGGGVAGGKRLERPLTARAWPADQPRPCEAVLDPLPAAPLATNLPPDGPHAAPGTSSPERTATRCEPKTHPAAAKSSASPTPTERPPHIHRARLTVKIRAPNRRTATWSTSLQNGSFFPSNRRDDRALPGGRHWSRLRIVKVDRDEVLLDIATTRRASSPAHQAVHRARRRPGAESSRSVTRSRPWLPPEGGGRSSADPVEERAQAAG